MHYRLEQCWELKKAGRKLSDFQEVYDSFKRPAGLDASTTNKDKAQDIRARREVPQLSPQDHERAARRLREALEQEAASNRRRQRLLRERQMEEV